MIDEIQPCLCDKESPVLTKFMPDHFQVTCRDRSCRRLSTWLFLSADHAVEDWNMRIKLSQALARNKELETQVEEKQALINKAYLRGMRLNDEYIEELKTLLREIDSLTFEEFDISDWRTRLRAAVTEEGNENTGNVGTMSEQGPGAPDFEGDNKE